MKSADRKTVLVALGNMVVMYLCVHGVINFLFRYIDVLTQYTFLFDGLIIISSILVGGLLTFAVKKKVNEETAGVYAASCAILLVLMLILSYALIPTMSVFAPQFMSVCFLIPGILLQLTLLLWSKVFKQFGIPG